ncbi:hypothetical protein [Companilactobacillus halodurans]|uniref:Uncharacterized protein n=1 Tax=Companilactobacillus halodurans TaxID=2584183 RepID=A0A5P0ZRJ5_9LACO|nr:hypothetical protein [Companilactobacillus halodurans]MQS76867.1 hypothetical protein [Companilactobacillus halodurans]MQS98099.1 hypothetical protein [Companilactobacillus halodurans]
MIIWDAIFDKISLKMQDMFSQPPPGKEIVDTYECFQFSSGLLANGTPGLDDHYELHGEIPNSGDICSRFINSEGKIANENIN